MTIPNRVPIWHLYPVWGMHIWMTTPIWYFTSLVAYLECLQTNLVLVQFGERKSNTNGKAMTMYNKLYKINRNIIIKFI
jgi:hypothetical protein